MGIWALSHVPLLGLLEAKDASPQPRWLIGPGGLEKELALSSQVLGSESRGRVWLEPTLWVLSVGLGG